MKRTLSLIAAMLASFAIDAAAQGLAPDCAAIRDANPTAADGDYIISPGGNTFTVYCHDMAGAPREYLTLVNTGGGRNYSAYGQLSSPPGNVITQYTRIRIDPMTLLVDISDQTFATSTGFQCCIGPTPVTSMPYANAASCIGWDDGHANVDLSGTAFKVRDTFTLDGWFPSGSIDGSYMYWGESRLVDAQAFSLTAGGSCGGMGPNPGGDINANGGFALQLEFLGGSSVGKDTCKSGGWQRFGVFRNQGDCVSYFATGGQNPPAR